MRFVVNKTILTSVSCKINRAALFYFDKVNLYSSDKLGVVFMGLKDRVKQRRELLGLSQKNIGDAVGVRQQTIQQIEDGKIKRSRHIEKIARVLKVTPEWLLFGTGHPEDKTLQSNESRGVKWIPVINWVMQKGGA